MTIRTIIGRAEAKAQGLKRYFTGIPCPHGHTCERQTSSAGCWECRAIAGKKSGRVRTHIPEMRRKWTKKWREAHPGAHKAIRHNMRARRRGAEGQHTQFDLHNILEQQGLSCCCGVSFLGSIDPTIDHKTPLSRGGSNWPDNIQLMCSSCNDSKGAKTMDEWAIIKRAA